MSGSTPRSDYFMSALGESLKKKLAHWDELESTLEGMIRLAEEQWGHISVPEEAFLGFIAGRLPEDDDTPGPELLSSLKAADLYIACACVRGTPSAIAEFEKQFVPLLHAALQRLNLDESVREETVQRVRRKLLVGEDSEAPRLVKYSGRGGLSSWLRVVAIREARDLLRRGKKMVNVDDEAIFDRATPQDDPELAMLKDTYREEFRNAVRTAFATLNSRDRNLLRHHYVDGLNIDEIGRSHGVHRATAARWLTKARQALHDATLSELMAKLNIGQEELESVMRLVVSQMHVTLSHLFKPSA